MAAWRRRILACLIAIGLIANLLPSVVAGPATTGGVRGHAFEIASDDAAVRALQADLKVIDCHSSGRPPDREGGNVGSDSCFDCRLCFKIALAIPDLELVSVTEKPTMAPFPPQDHRAWRVIYVRPPSRGPPATG